MLRTWSSNMSLRTRRSLSLGRANEAGEFRLSLGVLYFLFFARFVHLCTFESTSKTGSEIGSGPWRAGIQASLLLGVEVYLVKSAAQLAFLLPPLIISWTTVIVFEYIFGHLVNRVVFTLNRAVDKGASKVVGPSPKSAKVVKRGLELAKELSFLSAGRAVFPAVLCGTMIYVRGYIRTF